MPLTSNNLTLGLSAESADRVQAELGRFPGAAQAAITSALNETLRHARVAIGQAIRQDLNLAAAEVKQRIRLTRMATATEPAGEISIDYRPLKLIEFKPRPGTPAKGTRAGRANGITVSTIKGQAPLTLAHVFIAQTKTGHIGVFSRTGKGRLPIRESFGPSVASAFERAPGLADAAMADIGQTLEQRLASKIDWQLRTHGA